MWEAVGETVQAGLYGPGEPACGLAPSPALRDRTSPCGLVGEFVPPKPYNTEHTADVGEEGGPGQDLGPFVSTVDRL